MLDDSARDIGRLEGRVGGLEGRFERHELAVGEKLNTIEGKLDALVVAVAQGRGGLRVFQWLMALFGAAIGFVARHFADRH